MTDCTRKLRQERGASVVFALVIFLIVTLFSFTMVNGALTAAQNASMQREEEQAYLSVTSAARLFCHEAAFTLRYATASDTSPSGDDNSSPPSENNSEESQGNEDVDKNSTGDDSNSDGEMPVDDTENSTTTVYPLLQETEEPNPPQGQEETQPPEQTLTLFQTFFKTMRDEIVSGNSKAQKNMTIHSPKKGENSLEDFGEVQLTLTMESDYHVTANFRTSDTAPKNLQYSVSVSFRPIDNPSEGTITWTVESVKRGRYS